MSVVTDAVFAMEAAILAEFERTFPQDARSARIREVARAIATANGQGDYLDRIVMGHPHPQAGHGVTFCGKGTVMMTWPLQPCWATYAKDAIAAIEVCDAGAQP